MPRLSPLNPATLDSNTATLFNQLLQDYGPYANMLSAFAPRPPALKHFFSYLVQSREDGLISPRHLEIALLTASKAHACHYCVTLHTPKLAAHGISQDAIDRLLEPSVPGLDEQDLLVRDYAVLVTLTPSQVSDAFYSKLQSFFSEEQIVELTIRIALCSFFKRFNEALEVPHEDVVALELAHGAA
ncbi:carboxymuconolactone decarboxylase family protein [Achromobacter kerstersii]|uniref:carboxymuconolactone decarboxylase family protein n=1 Tax=Achromobacter kerstersii TaxID=1353890 RepID=UPI00313DFF29